MLLPSTDITLPRCRYRSRSILGWSFRSVSLHSLHRDRRASRKSTSNLGLETNYPRGGLSMFRLKSVRRNKYIRFPSLERSLGWESLRVTELVQFQPQDRVSQRLYQDVARLIERSFKREGRELDRSVNHYPEARLLLRHTRPRL